MPSGKINELFWLNYAQAIKDKTGADFSDSSVFFIGSEVQKAPPAGNGIPDEYTNQGLYDVANSLLTSDSLFYNPSSQHGYAQALETYFDWVDLGAKPNSTEDLNFHNAREERNVYQADHDKKKDQAYARFTRDEKRGLTNGMNFDRWVDNGHAPDYTMARNQLTAIGSRIAEIQREVGGRNYAPVDSARQKLNWGLNITSHYAGYNMQAATSNALSTAELLRKQAGHQTIPKPSTRLVPAYLIASAYKESAQNAQTRSGGKYEPKDSVEFSIDTESDTSEFNFGQTNAGADVDFSSGWLGFSTDSGFESTTIFETGGDASSVKIKLLFDKVEAVPILPGQWSPDVSQFKLRDDAPADLKGIVRPSQLIVATKFGYEITFSDSLSTSFDSQYEEMVSAGGSISILGLRASLDAAGSSTTEKNTHEAHWDSAHNTLTVQPKDNVQAATVLGVVGEKLSKP